MNKEKLEKIELISRICSYIAVPLLIAAFGWIIQSEINEKSLRKEYVQIAVSILNSQEKSPERSYLRDWAVKVLVQNSPIKFSEPALRALQSGSPLNPVEIKIPIPVSCITQLPARPYFITDEELEKMKDGNFVTALNLDRLKRQSYELELEAILTACLETSSLTKPTPPH
jgi:hypothetical protein